MINLYRATKQDLPAVSELLNTYGKQSIYPEMLNNKDIAIQARDETGTCVGFIWCGLMAQNTVGYIDMFTVHPDHANKGIGKMLAQALMDTCLKRRVRSVFGVIKHDQYHNKSAMNALRYAMAAYPDNFTFVYADVRNSALEVQSLEAR